MTDVFTDALRRLDEVADLVEVDPEVLERLRHPEMAATVASPSSDVANASVGMGSANTSPATPAVPSFAEAAVPETKAMSSSTVLDLADENPAVVLPGGAPGPATPKPVVPAP